MSHFGSRSMELRGEIGVADITIEVIQMSLGSPSPRGNRVRRDNREVWRFDLRPSKFNLSPKWKGCQKEKERNNQPGGSQKNSVLWKPREERSGCCKCSCGFEFYGNRILTIRFGNY